MPRRTKRFHRYFIITCSSNEGISVVAAYANAIALLKTQIFIVLCIRYLNIVLWSQQISYAYGRFVTQSLLDKPQTIWARRQTNDNADVQLP